MTVNVGFGALVLVLPTALYGVGAALYGARRNRLVWVESARLSVLVVFLLLSAAVFNLVQMLLSGAYEVAYVYDVVSSSMPPIFRLAGLWMGQQGILLTLAWVLSAAALAVSFRSWEDMRDYQPYVLAWFLAALFFFTALALFFENPFQRFWQLPGGETISAMFRPAESLLVVPVNGKGRMMLQNSFWMLLFPPLVLAASAFLFIPAAFAAAALLSRSVDNRWCAASRRWLVFGWLMLSLALMVYSRWTYDIKAGSQFWDWSFPQLAVLVSWLSSIAFWLSIQVMEKRGMMNRWRTAMALFTWPFSLYSILMVLIKMQQFFGNRMRSGGLFVLLGGILLLLVFELVLLVRFRRVLVSPQKIIHLLSRESLYMVDFLLCTGAGLIMLSGLGYASLAWLLDGQMISLQFFVSQAVMPLLILLMVLASLSVLSDWGCVNLKKLLIHLAGVSGVSLLLVMGLGFLKGGMIFPALLWLWLAFFGGVAVLLDVARAVRARRQRFGEGYGRALKSLISIQPSRYGTYFALLGLALISVGLVGLTYLQTEIQGTLSIGESLKLKDYTLTYTDFEHRSDAEGSRMNVSLALSLDRGGQQLDEMHPQMLVFSDTRQILLIPAVFHDLSGQIFVIPINRPMVSPDFATFQVYSTPLIHWMWLGELLLVLGGLLMAAPNQRPLPEYRYPLQDSVPDSALSDD